MEYVNDYDDGDDDDDDGGDGDGDDRLTIKFRVPHFLTDSLLVVQM